MKSTKVDMKAKLSRLMGLTMVGLMVLSLTSGTVMGADEAKKGSFHLYQEKPVDAAKAELMGFSNQVRVQTAKHLAASGELFDATVRDHQGNPREMMEAVGSFLKSRLMEHENAVSEDSKIVNKAEAVGELSKKDISDLAERIAKLDDSAFEGKDRKDAYLKLLKKIQDMSAADRIKFLQDAGGLDAFLKEIFKDEETLKTLGVTLKHVKPVVKPVVKPEVDEKEKPRVLPEPGPGFGNIVTPPPAAPTPKVGEIEAIVEKACADQVAERQNEKKNLFDGFLQQLNDLKDQLLNSPEKPAVASAVPPENDLLKKLSSLLGEDEEAPRVAENSAAPAAAAVTPQPSNRNANQQQIPQPMAPQQGAMGPMPQGSAPSPVAAIDAGSAPTPSVGKSALASATTVGETVKPISEMDPPQATTVIPPNLNLSPQQNAVNINSYYDDAARYTDSFKRSVNTSLAMVTSEQQNLAKQKTALSDTIDAQLEKQVPDEIKTAEQTAQQELQAAQSGLKSAETQAAMMMSSQDPSAAQAASATVAQANEKITQAQAKLASATQGKKDWKARQGQIDTTLKSRLEKLEAAETTLTTRATQLKARLAEVTQIASKNEQNRQSSLAGISTAQAGAVTGTAANVNAISGFNAGSSRRNQGLSGALNGSTTGQRAPLAGGI